MNDSSDMISPSPARQEVITAATARARQVKETVSAETGRAVENIKTAAREQLEKQRQELSQSLLSVQKALRNSSGKMEQSSLSPGVERLADAVGSAQQFLENHRVDDVGVALRRLSLKSPAVFYTGLFALGFVAGRFVTSTEKHETFEPEIEIDLLNAPPSAERPNPVGKAVEYHGSY